MATCTTEMAWAIRCPSLRNSPALRESVNAGKLTPVTISSEERTVLRFPVKNSLNPTWRSPRSFERMVSRASRATRGGDGVVGRAGGHQVPHYRGPGLEGRRAYFKGRLRQGEGSSPTEGRRPPHRHGSPAVPGGSLHLSLVRSGRGRLSGRCRPAPPPPAASRGVSPGPGRSPRRSAAPDHGKRQRSARVSSTVEGDS